jgi:hypothetical protein
MSFNSYTVKADTGDTAYADDIGGAMLAAKTLVVDDGAKIATIEDAQERWVATGTLDERGRYTLTSVQGRIRGLQHEEEEQPARVLLFTGRGVPPTAAEIMEREG